MGSQGSQPDLSYKAFSQTLAPLTSPVADNVGRLPSRPTKPLSWPFVAPDLPGLALQPPGSAPLTPSPLHLHLGLWSLTYALPLPQPCHRDPQLHLLAELSMRRRQVCSENHLQNSSPAPLPTSRLLLKAPPRLHSLSLILLL